MPFVRIPGLAGLVFVPKHERGEERKHNCADCYSCQMCSDDRCSRCLKRKACKAKRRRHG